MLIGQDSDNIYFGLQDDGSNAKHGTIIFGDDWDDYFTIQANDPSGTCTELMRILANGNVGIGTNHPTAKLDIRGRIHLGYLHEDLSTINNYERAIHFYSKGANTDTPQMAHTGGRIYSTNVNADTYGFGQIGGWEGQALVLEAGCNWEDHGIEQAFRKWQLVLLGNGNVGIGISHPTHALSVNGAIRAKEVVVDTGWADDVFDPGYKLASLADIKEHISKQGRLPGVPSAAEIRTYGVSLGEAISMLLRKNEELTLHIIKQQEQMEKLEEAVRALRSSKE